MVRFLLSGTPRTLRHTYDHPHEGRRTSAVLCVRSHSLHNGAKLHGWIKQKHFVGANIKAPIFISELT